MHITELGSDYFRFDEARQELRGERTGVRFSLGARVQVQVIRVDLDGRRIDFRLVHAGEALDDADAPARKSARRGTGRVGTRPAKQVQPAETVADALPDVPHDVEEEVWNPASSRRRKATEAGSAREDTAAGKRAKPGAKSAVAQRKSAARKKSSAGKPARGAQSSRRG